MSGNPLSTQEYMTEVTNILEAASKADITLRLLGATAFMKHCPRYEKMSEKMNRALTDIDFAGYSNQRDHILKLFKSIAYTYDIATYIETAMLGRLIFWKKDNPALHTDVFLDRLQFCHTIELKKRLDIDRETIPLAEMFLEKMQIVKIAEKDIKDIIILLLDHEVGDSDKDTININYIAELLSKDWGFYYTVTQNLQKELEYTNSSDILTGPEKENIKKKILQTLDLIEKKPKSMGWKIRARIGTKSKWYQEVESAERQNI